MRFLNKFLMFSLLASPLFLISEARSDLGKFAQCDARYPFNKAKRNECKKAVDKKRDVKKEVKANGGSNKDARQAGRAAKNEHMAQTNLFNAKSTARKQARADKLNTKVDCRLAGNHSNSECRKLGREAKLNTKADSGAYNFARTNRMKARAGGLGAQVDCLKNGGDKKSCRHIKRGERNRLKGEGRLAKFNQLNGVPSEQGYDDFNNGNDYAYNPSHGSSDTVFINNFYGRNPAFSNQAHAPSRNILGPARTIPVNAGRMVQPTQPMQQPASNPYLMHNNKVNSHNNNSATQVNGSL